MEINSSEHLPSQTPISHRKSFLTFLIISGAIISLLSIFYVFPSTLQYYPITLSHAGGYSTADLTFLHHPDRSFYNLFSSLIFFAVALGIIALFQVKRHWQWSFAFIFFSLVQVATSIINFNFGVCSSDFGDGGNWLVNCSYGFSPSITAGFLISLVLLIISISILVIAKRHQKTT